MNEPRVVILDTETTGFALPVEPVEIATLHLKGTPLESLPAGRSSHRYKPTRPIEDGAAAAHHILTDDLVDCGPFDPRSYADLGDPGVYLIGHQIDFDWEVIGRPGNPRRICTLALARRTWQEAGSHKLGALYYQVEGQTAEAREVLRDAHSAETDVWLTNRILAELIRIHEPDSWETLWEMSEIARIPLRMAFGKHGPDQKAGAPGVLISQLDAHDHGYRQWCLKQGDKFGDEYLRRALRDTPQEPKDFEDKAYAR